MSKSKKRKVWTPRMPAPQQQKMGPQVHRDVKMYDRKRKDWKMEEASGKVAGKMDWAEKLAMKLLRPLSIDPDSWESLLKWVRENASEGDSFEKVLVRAKKALKSDEGGILARELLKVARELLG